MIWCRHCNYLACWINSLQSVFNSHSAVRTCKNSLVTSWLTGFGFNLSALYQIFWEVAGRSWCCCSDGRWRQDRHHCWKRPGTDTDSLHASLLYSASSITATQNWHFHLHWLKPICVTHSSSCPLGLIALCAGSLCVRLHICDRMTP